MYQPSTQRQMEEETAGMLPTPYKQPPEGSRNPNPPTHGTLQRCHAKPDPDSAASGYTTLPDQALMRLLAVTSLEILMSLKSN